MYLVAGDKNAKFFLGVAQIQYGRDLSQARDLNADPFFLQAVASCLLESCGGGGEREGNWGD